MSAPFLKLIQTGSTAEVADAVQADPGLIYTRDPQDVSMLLWSVYSGQELIRNFLLAHLSADGVPLNIFEAAAVGDEPSLRALLEKNPELSEAFSGDGWTALHLAAAFGSPAAVAILLAGGARTSAVSRNPQQNQPLHAALALGKNTETIHMLLAHGAAADATQAGGFTPLFSAAVANRKDLVELLLAHGADPNRQSDNGKTAAEFARERGHQEIAAWLEAQSKQ